MNYLPIEAKIDVLKFLDFNQLFSVRLINWHFNALIDKYEFGFARKEQSLIYIAKLTERDYELYRCKEEILEENVKEEKISFLKRIWNKCCCKKKADKKIVKEVKKCTCDRRFLNNEELEPFNFPISSQLLEKHIETSTDLTKMVANIVLHFRGWSDLKLSERAKNFKQIRENSISYELSNIHNPKMKKNNTENVG
uniref:F-box domain-containing protein n=1 Tax=Meloidogyne hapla TaxID=6305 RepID=A0A1I8BJ03_MELHA